MALNTLKCNHLASLGLKGLKAAVSINIPLLCNGHFMWWLERVKLVHCGFCIASRSSTLVLYTLKSCLQPVYLTRDHV